MKIKSVLSKIPDIEKIKFLAEKQKLNLWLVGGVLRDACLRAGKKSFNDFDFCLEKNIDSFVHSVAGAVSGKLIPLDKKNPSFRVAAVRKDRVYTYDFTIMRGRCIKEDLLTRDFTINTLALDLKRFEILDYYGAKKDLRKKKIRALSEAVIIEDPLRILRGFSFSAQYGFKIEPRTLSFFSAHKGKVKEASPERINEEIFKILSASFSYKTIKKMDTFGLADEIIPQISRMRHTGQGGFHHLPVWEHSIEALKQIELVYEKKLKRNKEIESYLNQKLAKGKKRIQILKLACLLHDIGKPAAEKKEAGRTIFHTHEKIGKVLSGEFAARIRLSNKEKQSLEKMVFWHLRPGYLADQIKPSRRAVYRFFRDTGEEGVSVILLSLADWRATRGPLTDSRKRRRHEKVMLNLVKDYFSAKKKRPLPKIVNGHDVMKNFSLKSGPVVGKVLKKIKELQALGEVNEKKQALRAAEKIISNLEKEKNKN